MRLIESILIPSRGEIKTGEAVLRGLSAAEIVSYPITHCPGNLRNEKSFDFHFHWTGIETTSKTEKTGIPKFKPAKVVEAQKEDLMMAIKKSIFSEMVDVSEKEDANTLFEKLTKVGLSVIVSESE